MSAQKRQSIILDWVREEHHVDVDAISNRFGVTPQTIRRDINHLCEQGLLRRRYGGVSLPSAALNSAANASSVNLDLTHQKIASEIAKQIPNGASVSLGGGAGLVQVATALLNHTSLKVLTNSLSVASALASNSEIEVIVSGGQFRHANNDVVGPEVTNFFSSFFSDFGVISCGSIDAQHGLMDFDIREAEANRAIISNTRTKILLADQEKWHAKAMCKVATFKYVDLFFTDQMTQEEVESLPDCVKSFQVNPIRL
ncbi:DeoR/GlpR family DNA-binding transcription regulator [Reinekea marina]|uniref:DeoR/GlpR family DNA-binding transcription regulator n=1 Tax=Reinekea marina TaxID=1310421 RepID=A0ABV7WSR2_9GAMM|nr:DeoR/GlpR family DNA-binding transcription regulator [Reinekea marina]MDN3648995.1 DeoR/GlpR family DNA-binding transcription regulator [Reinekea marina]